MGLWVVGVGFGPVGYFELGFLASAAGVQAAQALNGIALMVLAIIASGLRIPSAPLSRTRGDGSETMESIRPGDGGLCRGAGGEGDLCT
jgi:hypothetical protein